MIKIEITEYYKSNALMPKKGGMFIITESEYIIKGYIFTVARYEISKTLVSKISFLFRKGIRLNDGEKEIDVYFLSKTAERLYQLLRLK